MRDGDGDGLLPPPKYGSQCAYYTYRPISYAVVPQLQHIHVDCPMAAAHCTGESEKTQRIQLKNLSRCMSWIAPRSLRLRHLWWLRDLR